MRELPTGTVTFLFTDIEGSTRLLHEHGERYAELLAEHRRVLRDAFARHGGVEVDTQGDAFFVAFARATDALAAAAASQATLLEGPVRVRMGVHTGEPVVMDEGYVGMDVHRAARIAAAGHGGQVLVSQSTRDLAGAEGLRDLGEFRLKDLSSPERLYQLGDRDFPPLKSLYQASLPVPATPFIGRDEELGSLTKMLAPDDVRLVTLTGPGGCGKTRLALEAAARSAERYPAGVRWVPLAAVRDVALVGEALAAGVDASDGAASAIGEKRLLLLLDNFEHVVDAAPEVGMLLAECPRLDVLVTSRERLGLAGEHVYETPTLARRDAVELFVRRAGALRPGFAADDDVARVCEQLDDLPLALELAAASVRVFTPRQLAERLSRRLDVLKGGRGADPRQATLRATIEWSHDLLAPEEQEAFARLGVFVGGWTLETAEEICDVNADLIAALVDKSLVRTREEVAELRFWMLETIREFAVERLDASAVAGDLRRRHAEAFAALAEVAEDAPRGPESARLLESLEAELPNIRAAVAWAVDVQEGDLVLRIVFGARRLLGRRNNAELRDLVEAGVAAGATDPTLRAGALGIAAFAAYRQGDLAASRRLGDEALEIAREAGDEQVTRFALNSLAAVDVAEGEFERARRRYEEHARLARETGDARSLAVTAHNLGDLEFQIGDFAAAAKYADEALEAFRAIDDRDGIGTALLNAASARFFLGEDAEAARLAGEGVTLGAELESGYEVACGLLVLAGVAARSRRATRAGLLLGAAASLVESVGAELEPAEVMLRDRVRAAAPDDDDFARNEAKGRVLPVEAAVELALSDRDA